MEFEFASGLTEYVDMVSKKNPMYKVTMYMAQGYGLLC